MQALEDFVGGNTQILKLYLQRLEELRKVLEQSDFFRAHEVKDRHTQTNLFYDP